MQKTNPISIIVPARAFSLKQFRNIYDVFHRLDDTYHIIVMQDRYAAQWAYFMPENGPRLQEDLLKKSWTVTTKDFAKLSYEEAKDRIEMIPPQLDCDDTVMSCQPLFDRRA